MSESREGRRVVQGILHGVAVLELLAGSGSPLSLSEISRAVGLTKGSVHAIVASLELKGLVERDPLTGKYRRGWGLWSLGADVIQLDDPFPLLGMRMAIAAQEIGETVILSICDRDQLLYVCQRQSSRTVGTAIRVGSRAPMHSTAAGKLLLAFHPERARLIQEIRRAGLPRITGRTILDIGALEKVLDEIVASGHSFALEENEVGLNAVAVPLGNTSGRVVAAVSSAGPSGRFDQSQMEFAIDVLRRLVDSWSLTGGN